MSLRDRILAVEDRPASPIEVPEWGETLYLRPLSAADRVEVAVRVKDGLVPWGVLVALGVFDGNGNRVFDIGDLDAINAKRGEVVERLGREVMRVNRLGEADTAAAAKN